MPKYLVKGASAFDAAAWGGSAMAATDDFVIEESFGTIVGSDLNQSGIAGGFESMQITQNASGTIGGGGNGPFIADFDNSADAYISNRGYVTMYFQAGGDGATCNNYDCGANSQNYLQGGTIGTLTQDGGMCEVNASTVLSDAVHLDGGRLKVWYNASNLTSFEQNGGTSEWMRMPDTATINAGRCTLDIDNSEDMTSKTLNVKGKAVVELIAGEIPTINIAGTLDLSKVRRPLDLSASTITISGGGIIENALVTLPTIQYPGALKRNIGGAIQID